MASRICWNCEKDAHQTLVGSPVRESAEPQRVRQWFGFYQCDQCGYATVGRMDIPLDDLLMPNRAKVPVTERELADGTFINRVRSKFDARDADPEWLPQHVRGRRFEDVPDPIADAASEAYACYSIRSYRAAILMARSVIEAVAKDQEITNGNLAEKIDALAKKDLIRPLIQQSAHEIRHLGNDMAHGDFVDPTTADDADDVLHFMSVVLAEVYQLPAQVNARQETRAARKEAAAERKAEAETPTST